MSEGERRLAAVVFTDMVGYTALAQRDEVLALELLQKHNSILRGVFAKHSGREVKTIGDAFLLEFASALSAVLCSVDMQAALAEHNKASSDQEKLVIRIGIHMGDVVHQDGDILGDPVNIASRIVNAAEGGGIWLSEHVYSQVKNKLQYPVEKMPEQILKNVELEMDLYRILLPWEVAAEPGTPPTKNRIAILPFTNVSPDPGDGYFAEGLTDELISALSEVQGLRVIARTSVNKYRGTTKGAKQVGSELQVPYILEGSVRKAGEKIRISTRLVEVATQEQVWSSRYDRDLDDVFSIQSDISRSVADALKVTLLTGEKARIEKKDTEDLAAYAAYLKGRALLHERTETAIKSAKDQFELAITLDPRYAKAYAGMADINVLLGDYLFAPVPTALEDATKYVEKALELDPELAEAHTSLANLYMFDFRFSDAEREFRKAIELNPSYATAHHWFASLLEDQGRTEEALKEVVTADQLDPLSTAIALSVIYRLLELGRTPEALKRIQRLEETDPRSPPVTEAYMVYYFAQKDWDRTLSYLDEMRAADPSDPYLDMDLGFIYAVTGRKDEALEVIEKLRAVPADSRIRGTLIAQVYAALGDLDQVFGWLDYAFENKEVFFGWFRNNPLVANVRSDPRFSDLLRRANLPP